MSSVPNAIFMTNGSQEPNLTEIVTQNTIYFTVLCIAIEHIERNITFSTKEW